MQRLPKIFYNPISLTGLVIVVFNIGFIVFLSIVEAFSTRAHPYAYLVIWLVLPGLVLFGAVLIIVGIRRDRRKEREGGGAERRFPVIDFNDPRHRKVSVLLLMGFLLLSLLYAFAGYKAFEFTESEIVDLRARAEPMFCYIQGLESLACLIARDGRLEKIGVQAFAG